MSENYQITTEQQNEVSALGSKVKSIGEFLSHTTPDEFGSNAEFYWNVGEILRDAGGQISEIVEGAQK